MSCIYIITYFFRPYEKAKEDEIFIEVGFNSLTKYNPTRETYSVKKIFPHEKFSFLTAENDIGLIQLNYQIKFNENIKPINLPVGTDLHKANYTATATGWGTLEVKIIFENVIRMFLNFIM